VLRREYWDFWGLTATAGGQIFWPPNKAPRW
jgi:hypothetical protein